MKAKYTTKQMIELHEYLKSVEGKHVTVNDIIRYFDDKGISVGTTTIYRNLEKLVEQGCVAKYIIDGTTSACFEYIGDSVSNIKNIDNNICYHCKCEKCGKLIHLQCNEVEKFKEHMMGHHNFLLNPIRTTFYGICGECREN